MARANAIEWRCCKCSYATSLATDFMFHYGTIHCDMKYRHFMYRLGPGPGRVGYCPWCRTSFSISGSWRNDEEERRHLLSCASYLAQLLINSV